MDSPVAAPVNGWRITIIALFLSSMLAVRSAEGQRNVLSVEANPFRGSLSYVRDGQSNWDPGFQVGFGVPQIDITVNSDSGDFIDILHLAAIIRRSTDRTIVELGLRGGVAQFYQCGSSDCWPGLYAGPSLLVAAGGRRWKVGTRIIVGQYYDTGRTPTNFASVSPLNVLFDYRW